MSLQAKALMVDQYVLQHLICKRGKGLRYEWALVCYQHWIMREISHIHVLLIFSLPNDNL